MNKAYDPTTWKNAPSTDSPINDVNLNKISRGLDVVDNRVIDLDSAKANQQDLLLAVKSFGFDENTGIITITQMNGTTSTYNTNIAKLAVNFAYDATTQILTITMKDGSTAPVDLSSLISQSEFLDSSEIAAHVNATTGTVYFDIIAGSITSDKLETNFLMQVQTAADNAAASADAANSSANDADYDRKLSQSYAIGGSGEREGEDTDNSKYYKEQAAAISANVSEQVEAAEGYASSAGESATTASEQAQSASESATSASTSLQSINSLANQVAENVQIVNAAVIDASDSAQEASDSAIAAASSAASVAGAASTAKSSADLAKSYAVGDTGTRSGEDTDNAKYYKEQARQIVGDKGHIIQDVDGTTYDGRANLRFRNATVSDDEGADTTNVTWGITDTQWTQINTILA